MIDNHGKFVIKYCMSKKLSTIEINQKLSERRIKIVGEYINSQTKTEFMCGHGHIWMALPAIVIHGTGCPHCARNIPLSKEIINDMIVDSGITMIGEYMGSKINSLFMCNFGHQWMAKPNNILSNNGCPHCSRQFRLTKEIVNERINHRGIFLVGDYINNKTKTEFMCEHGHTWLTRTDDVLNGHGCPYCTKRGYSPSKPGTLYLLDFGHFIKYGITNDSLRRLREHQHNGQYTVLFTKFYEDGRIPQNLERQIKQQFGGRFVTKDIMPDGWTETLCKSKLEQIMESII
jgi:glutaredoxin